MNPDWKTNVLLRLRDTVLAELVNLRRGGVDATPLPAVVLMLERELARREIATSEGVLQVQAQVQELTP